MRLSSTPPTNDPAELVARDHRRILELFGSCKLAGGPRGEVVSLLVRSLEAHAAAEEAVLHPVMLGAFGAPAVRRSLAEHRHMQRLVTRLEHLDPDGAHASALLADLEDEMRRHAVEEEGETLPLLRRRVPAWRWADLADAFRAERERAMEHGRVIRLDDAPLHLEDHERG